MATGSLLRFPGQRGATQRYVHELSSIYGRDFWIDDPDFALASDDEIYAKLERDPVVYHALQLRTLTVAGQQWHLEPPTDEPEDKALARWLEELLGKIRDFSQARMLLFRGGLLSGRGYGWIRGERRRLSIDGNKAEKIWVPLSIEHQDKRSFRYDAIHGEHVEGKGRSTARQLKFWSIREDKWVALRQHELRALIQMKYMNRADRLGYGQGIAVPLYLYFRAKGLAWQDWMAGGERWGQGGIVTARIDAMEKGSTDRSNDDIQDEWLDTIEKMRSRHALVFDKADEVDVIEPSSTGVMIPADIIEYCDKAITRLILGAIRPTGADTDTGARAQAEVEQESTDVLTQYDRAQLDEALTDHLVKCVFDLNRPAIRAAGLAKAAMPKFVSSMERKADPQKAMATIGPALQAGIPLKRSEVYEKLGLQPPAEDDEVFTGVSGASPMPFKAAED